MVEIIVAITLIAIVSVTSLAFYSFTAHFGSLTNLRLMAANFARQTMERQYMKTYANLTLGGPYSDSLPTSGLYSVLYNFGGSRNYKVESPTGGGSNYKVITVTVSWD